MKMSQMIPAKVIVTARDGIRPGTAVVLRFKMSEKNDYSFIVFLDAEGRKEVGQDELLREFDQTANAFLMDYVNARAVFTGTIEAHVLTQEELESAMRAYDMFNAQLDYAPDYLDKLKSAFAINAESKCVINVEQIR